MAMAMRMQEVQEGKGECDLATIRSVRSEKTDRWPHDERSPHSPAVCDVLGPEAAAATSAANLVIFMLTKHDIPSPAHVTPIIIIINFCKVRWRRKCYGFFVCALFLWLCRISRLQYRWMTGQGKRVQLRVR